MSKCKKCVESTETCPAVDLAEARRHLAGRRVLELDGSANAALLLWADVHREVGLIARATGPGELGLALAAIDPGSLAAGLEQLAAAAADLAARLRILAEEAEK